MCGRFNLTSSLDTLIAVFGLEDWAAEAVIPELKPRYNIAPSQSIPVIRNSRGKKQLVFARWGLVPHWSKEPVTKYSTINARSETVADKPAYRDPFKRRRCLIPATGFYEWQQQGDGKIPYHICRRDGSPFAFAGLWDHWQKEGNGFDSCSIIVTTANALMQPIHDRMPVILPPDLYDAWLDPGNTSKDTLLPMLRPYDNNDLHAYPVSRYVNSPRHDSPECIKPL